MLKKLNIMSILFLYVLLSGCSEQAKGGLNGTWIGDYSCTNVKGTISEEIKITQDNDFYLVATKITGDDCVPAGEKSFEGRISKPIKCIGGWPDKPSSATFDSAIVIESANQFNVCNVSFKRKK
jgi:hypothetical protein